MEEMLGTLGGGDPSEGHLKLYDEWSQGGWGMILTGELCATRRKDERS